MAIVQQQLRNSTTAAKPGDLEPGQLAYNLADLLGYIGDGSNEKTDFLGANVLPAPTAGKGWVEFPLKLGDIEKGLDGAYVADPLSLTPPAAAATSGQVLTWDPAANTGSGAYVPTSLSLDDLSDVDTTSKVPIVGDALLYNGADFVPGVAAASPIGGLSLSYNYESSTVLDDPGAGDWRVDNADLTLATKLVVNKTTRLGNDAAVVWDNLNVGDYLGIWEETGDRSSIYYAIKGITDSVTWLTFNVAVIPGTAPTFNNNTATEIFTIKNPANQIPAGGKAGDVLIKDTAADYDVSWSDTLDGGAY